MRSEENSDKNGVTQDLSWVAKSTPELQKEFAGKWVAVVNKEIVGWGDTAKEAYKRARETYPQIKPLLGVIPTEECLILRSVNNGSCCY